MSAPFELVGTIFGATYPLPIPPPPETDDARRHALEGLRSYMATLRFYRRGPTKAQSNEFTVPEENILLEMPDAEKDLKFPAIAVIPGEGEHDSMGLGPPQLIEETADKFAPGTALLRLGEYIETITLEAWGSYRAERRALMVGLAQALRVLEQSYSLRLRLLNYYGCVAEFTLMKSRYVEDVDAALNRRRGWLMVGLRVPEVRLVNYTTLKPFVAVEVSDDPNFVVEVEQAP